MKSINKFTLFLAIYVLNQKNIVSYANFQIGKQHCTLIVDYTILMTAFRLKLIYSYLGLPLVANIAKNKNDLSWNKAAYHYVLHQNESH